MDFTDTFSKNFQIPYFMKIRLVEAELFRAGGRTDGKTSRETDMTKLTVAFGKFAKNFKK
jgi:hypothetical protein